MQTNNKLQSCPLHQQGVGKYIELNFLGTNAPHPPTVIHNDLLSNSIALYQISYPSAITPIQEFLALALALNHQCLYGFPKCTDPAKDSIALLKSSHRSRAVTMEDAAI